MGGCREGGRDAGAERMERCRAETGRHVIAQREMKSHAETEMAATELGTTRAGLGQHGDWQGWRETEEKEGMESREARGWGVVGKQRKDQVESQRCGEPEGERKPV